MISGAGRTEHYRYNSRNQLTELDSTAGTVRYEYDPAGSLTAEVHTAQGGGAAERTGYTYDAYNRNTSVCGAGYVQQNHYDAEGLRYAVTENGKTTNFVYRNGMPVSELDADKNPVRGYILGNEYISQVDGTSFGYYLNDEQGSVWYLTGSDGSIRNHYRYSAYIGYTYDVYSRNTAVCGAGYVQQNHYDAEGLRYAVTENRETTNFVYRNGMPVSELDADKNPVRGYVLGNEYISQVNGTTFGYYLNDGQGSVRYLTGSDGSIRNHYRYSAFGETITAEETVPNRLRYNGQMADGLTGLYYLRARYYNASLGRFTQEDVIYNDGLNLYAYCNSNPVMYSDPSGFAKQCDPKVGGEKDSKSGGKSYSLLPGEGDIGTYRDLIKAGKRGDNITPHHMPSAGYMKQKGVANSDG